MKSKKTGSNRFPLFIPLGIIITFFIVFTLEQISFTRGTTGIAPDLNGAVEGMLLIIFGIVMSVILAFLKIKNPHPYFSRSVILLASEIIAFFIMMLLFWGR